MKRVLIVIIGLSLISCSTVATQSKSGKTLKIKGNGKATFENGASIEGKSWFPELKVFK